MSGSRRAVRPVALDLAKALERGEARAIRERASVLRLLDQAEKLGIDLHVLIEGAQARLKAKQVQAELDAAEILSGVRRRVRPDTNEVSRPMSGHSKRFLRILLDGEWHTFDKLPRGVGVSTVRRCIEQGFVRTKKVDRKRIGDLETYRTSLRITKLGRVSLLG